MLRTLQTLVLAGCFLCVRPALATWSCGAGGELGDRVQVEFEGSVFYVTTPEDYDESRAWPVIFGLHGDEGDPASSVNFFWRDVTDGRFIFVAPKAPNASGSWYEVQADNEAWMDRLFATITGAYNVDLDRVYIWGLSGGAVFSSRYIMARQDVFAAAEMNMGGNGRNYTAPPAPECKIPARFVVSTTDFLREQALSFYDLLTAEGHETEWVDADCEGHCWDDVQAGTVARDWLLGHTLCGAEPDPTASCSGTGGSGGGAGTGGQSGSGGDAGNGAGGSSSGGAAGSSGAGNAGTAGGGASGTAGSSGSNPGGSSGSGAGPAAGNPGSASAAGADDSLDGCACRSVPRSAPSGSLLAGAALGVVLLAERRRRRR